MEKVEFTVLFSSESGLPLRGTSDMRREVL